MVQPLATILIDSFLTEWDTSVPFSTPRDWNYSRFLLMIFGKSSRIFHTDGYLEIAWNQWSRWRYERRSTQPEQEQDKLLDYWGLNTHVKDNWLYLPFDCLQSSKILNQTIRPPLDVLHMHIDTVVASHHHLFHYKVPHVIFCTPQNSLSSSPHRYQHRIISCQPQQLFSFPT